MDRISLTWLIYGVIAACIGIATTTNMLSTRISTALLSIYAIIGIILVFTVKNKKENYENMIERYENIDNVNIDSENAIESYENVNNENHNHTKNIENSLDMNKCNTNISSYFNPLPHEPRNELIGTANDPLSEPGIDFRSTPPGPYSTNQLAYKFNMA